MERDVPLHIHHKVHSHFNSHAHVERDVYVYIIQHNLANFNSHAHVERDEDLIASTNLSPISTHTLTWSVTQIPCNFFILL